MAPALTTEPTWRVIGQSIRGAQHVRQGKPCQDALAWRPTGPAVALAVADGHGSERCPYSDAGAVLAVASALDLLCDLHRHYEEQGQSLSFVKRYAEEQLPRLLVRAWAAGVAAAGGAADRLLEYGSTLLAALLAPDFMLFLRLGDGDILTVGQDGAVDSPLPEEGQRLGEETASLCSPAAWQAVRVRLVPLLGQPPALVLLSTDGYGKSFASAAAFRQVGPDYLELIRAHGLEAVAASLAAWLQQASQEGSGDDTTLALAYWAAERREGKTGPAGLRKLVKRLHGRRGTRQA